MINFTFVTLVPFLIWFFMLSIVYRLYKADDIQIYDPNTKWYLKILELGFGGMPELLKPLFPKKEDKFPINEDALKNNQLKNQSEIYKFPYWWKGLSLTLMFVEFTVGFVGGMFLFPYLIRLYQKLYWSGLTVLVLACIFIVAGMAFIGWGHNRLNKQSSIQ